MTYSRLHLINNLATNGHVTIPFTLFIVTPRNSAWNFLQNESINPECTKLTWFRLLELHLIVVINIASFVVQQNLTSFYLILI